MMHYNEALEILPIYLNTRRNNQRVLIVAFQDRPGYDVGVIDKDQELRRDLVIVREF